MRGWYPINHFNTATFLCLSQPGLGFPLAHAMVVNVFNDFRWEVIGFFCWYWLNCWPSLFINLLFITLMLASVTTFFCSQYHFFPNILYSDNCHLNIFFTNQYLKFLIFHQISENLFDNNTWKAIIIACLYKKAQTQYQNNLSETNHNVIFVITQLMIHSDS